MPLKPNEKATLFDDTNRSPDVALLTANVTSSEPPTEIVAEVAFNNATRIDVTEFDGTTETREVLVLDKEAVIEHGGGLVKSISFNEAGRPKLKMYDAQKALKTILDGHGHFNHTQKHDVEGLADFLASAFDDNE